MTWTKLTPSQPGRVAGVSFSIVREPKAKNGARMFISVARAVGEAGGLGARTRVDIFIGDGEEAGHMKIVPDPG